MAVPWLDLVKVCGVELLLPHIPHPLCLLATKMGFSGRAGTWPQDPASHFSIPSQEEKEGIICISLSGTPGFEALNSAEFGLIPASTRAPLSLRVALHLQAASAVTFQHQQCSHGL